MFESLREFFAMLDVHPIWPGMIVALSFLQCLVPYKPIAKIEETKDKDGKKAYTIYENRNK